MTKNVLRLLLPTLAFAVGVALTGTAQSVVEDTTTLRNGTAPGVVLKHNHHYKISQDVTIDASDSPGLSAVRVPVGSAVIIEVAENRTLTVFGGPGQGQIPDAGRGPSSAGHLASGGGVGGPLRRAGQSARTEGGLLSPVALPRGPWRRRTVAWAMADVPVNAVFLRAPRSSRTRRCRVLGKTSPRRIPGRASLAKASARMPSPTAASARVASAVRAVSVLTVLTFPISFQASSEAAAPAVPTAPSGART